MRTILGAVWRRRRRRQGRRPCNGQGHEVDLHLGEEGHGVAGALGVALVVVLDVEVLRHPASLHLCGLLVDHVLDREQVHHQVALVKRLAHPADQAVAWPFRRGVLHGLDAVGGEDGILILFAAGFLLFADFPHLLLRHTGGPCVAQASQVDTRDIQVHVFHKGLSDLGLVADIIAEVSKRFDLQGGRQSSR